VQFRDYMGHSDFKFMQMGSGFSWLRRQHATGLEGTTNPISGFSAMTAAAAALWACQLRMVKTRPQLCRRMCMVVSQLVVHQS